MFDNARRALTEFDLLLPTINLSIAEAKTNKEVDYQLRNCRHEESKVQKAFYLDTKSHNSYSTCMLMPLSAIRYLVARHSSAPSQEVWQKVWKASVQSKLPL